MKPLLRPQLLPRPRMLSRQCLRYASVQPKVQKSSPKHPSKKQPKPWRPKIPKGAQIPEKKLFGMLHRRRNVTYPQKLPPYPYGLNLHYKASNLGLYGGARIASGNNVSEITKTKTRRRWYPNVHNKRLWSNALDKFLRVKVTARVLRTIDKVGGVDEYLLGEKQSRIRELGLKGWVLRWQVMQTPWYKTRRRLEAERLGLTKEDLREIDRRNEEFMRTGKWVVPAAEVPSEKEIEAVNKAVESDEGIDLTEGEGLEETESEEKVPFMAEQPLSEPPRPRL